MTHYALSICIATRNRAAFLKEMLASIVEQLEPAIEVLILDGASSDSTNEVVGVYMRDNPQVRYFREADNSGVDRGYDKAVELASGRYCWLLTDDDRLRPGAIRRVRSALGDSDAIILNSEVRNRDFSVVLEESRLSFDEDRLYDANSMEQFFIDCTYAMTFIGAIVIVRDLWLARNRAAFYGSEFVHLGVIFQRPLLGSILVIAEPQIMVRNGNAMWSPRTFEVWAVKFPRLIWSFPELSDLAKNKVTGRYPWRDPKTLFYWRAVGAYSNIAYAQYIAGTGNSAAKFAAWIISLCPGSVACAISILYLRILRRSQRLRMYEVLNGKYRGATSFLLSRLLGISRLVESRNPEGPS